MDLISYVLWNQSRRQLSIHHIDGQHQVFWLPQWCHMKDNALSGNKFLPNLKIRKFCLEKNYRKSDHYHTSISFVQLVRSRRNDLAILFWYLEHLEHFWSSTVWHELNQFQKFFLVHLIDIFPQLYHKHPIVFDKQSQLDFGTRSFPTLKNCQPICQLGICSFLIHRLVHNLECLDMAVDGNLFFRSDFHDNYCPGMFLSEFEYLDHKKQNIFPNLTIQTKNWI